MQSGWASGKQQVIQAQQQLRSWPGGGGGRRHCSTSQEAARASHLSGARVLSAEVRRAAAPWLQLASGRAARASM